MESTGWSEAGAGTGVAEAALRRLLQGRRERLAGASARLPHAEEALRLLGQVDAALERLDGGSWGQCERCHETIESERLHANPLVRVCLGCLSDGEARALERDLELASSIQAALLPARLVRRAGWEIGFRYLPLGPVSGDHCDVLLPELSDEPLHVVLGDVSGKGVASALLMAHLQAALRALVRTPQPLDALVGRANRLLCEGTAGGSHATAVIGRLEPDGTVELCNAGHCPPIVVRRDGSAILAATGLPLGLIDGAAFELHRLSLEPGDLLFAYTDGLSETSNGDVELGRSSVAETVGALRHMDVDALLDACIDSAARFRAGEARTDDLTLMAVRRIG